MERARFVDEIGFAFGWIAPEPRFMERASHVLTAEGRVWVIDPVADEDALARARELGDPAGVLQLLDRHGSDCRTVAEQLGVPHYEVPEQSPAGAPFEVLPLLRRRWWHEVALWFPEQRTLVCADAVGTPQYYRAPGERLGVSPLLRLTPPRRLLTVEPDHVLGGHARPPAHSLLALGRPPRTRSFPQPRPLAACLVPEREKKPEEAGRPDRSPAPAARRRGSNLGRRECQRGDLDDQRFVIS